MVLGDSCGFGLVGEAEFDDFACGDFVNELAGDDVAFAELDRWALLDRDDISIKIFLYPYFECRIPRENVHGVIPVSTF